MRAPRRPRSAADPRPGDRPFYIAPACPACGTALILAGLLETPPLRPAELWHDEWECPVCRDGIHLDWPEAALHELASEALTGEAGLSPEHPGGPHSGGCDDG